MKIAKTGLTVKQLIAALKQLPENMEVRTFEGMGLYKRVTDVGQLLSKMATWTIYDCGPWRGDEVFGSISKADATRKKWNPKPKKSKILGLG